MLALISPAKKLDFKSEWLDDLYSQPILMKYTNELIKILKNTPRSRLKSLMKLSDNLTELNYERFQRFSTPFTSANSRPAIFAFRGDTYTGLDSDNLSQKDLKFAQNHIRILSGLYGLLRPLDLMQAYRLEMGTKLANHKGEDLYDFWGEIITNACNDATKNHKDRTVICLASNEYIKAVKPQLLEGDFITCHFKEIKNGQPKIIGLFAKRARGAMARYIIQNQIEQPQELKTFDIDGYEFQNSLSDSKNYVFIRE